MTGNTVVLDHGLGVFTLYCHLEDFTDIEVGDSVKKGNPIGRLGMTGYASGYHLHWELRINNISVDPFEWTTSIY
jgi:murein DD-endopeptidase MepM/ murein hydrolase activator NlpD